MAIDMVSIGEAIYETGQRLREGSNVLYRYAKEYAAAERTYKIELAREIVTLRDQGLPVTLVADVARGNVAELKYNRDLAEMTYKTTRDMLNALQSEMSGLQTLYRRQEEV